MCMKIGIFVLRKLLNISFNGTYFPHFVLLCAASRVRRHAGCQARHIHRRRRHVFAQRQAFHREGRRGSLSAHPPSLLGPPHQDVQGFGYEHGLHLHFLEHPRTAGGQLRLLRQQRCGRVLPSGAEERHVCHRAPRTLCLCGVGDGRSALVAAQEEGHQVA